MKVKRKMIGVGDHEAWGADEWADATFEVPAEECEGLLVVVSGDAGNVRYWHAVLFADYDPETGFEVYFPEQIEPPKIILDPKTGLKIYAPPSAAVSQAPLDIEYWRPVPTLPWEIRKEIGEL